MKKKWIKPELLSIVRSKPEEAVLSLCKYLSTEWQWGPASGARGCYLYVEDQGWPATSCSANTKS